MRVLLLLLISLIVSQMIAQEGDVEVKATAVAVEAEEKKQKKKEKEPTEAEITQQIFQAIDAGDTETVKPLLNAMTYYKLDDAGETALTKAVKNGDLSMVKLLVKDAVINLKNKDGETPLTLAIKMGDAQIIRYVAKRAKAALKNDAGEAPLFLAVQETDDLYLLKELIKKGADVNRKSNGVTPLAVATTQNKVKTVALLVKNDADVSLPNDNGDIPLYIAVRSGHDFIAGILLHYCQDPTEDANWNTKIGETLLNRATEKGYGQIVLMLLESGADVNKPDYLDNTALNIAAEKGYLPIAETLLLHGASANHRNIMGDTPITLAAKHGHQELANLLAENGANPEVRNYKGVTAAQFVDFEEILMKRNWQPSDVLQNEQQNVKDIDFETGNKNP